MNKLRALKLKFSHILVLLKLKPDTISLAVAEMAGILTCVLVEDIVKEILEEEAKGDESW